MKSPTTRGADHRSWRPFALLALALAWVVLERVPLVLNARAHLDSDLAVDGLTLAEAVRGHWHWHFPGTPHMGIGPLLLAWPQAALWGATPGTLVTGGVAAYALLVITTFALAWRTFGARVAEWTLVPLAFCSTGTIWLSGRLTGGHLLTAAWHAGAFYLLVGCLRRRSALRVLGLGLWCGLGLYDDRMLLFSLAALVTAGVSAWGVAGRSAGGLAQALAFLLGVAVGYLPQVVGARAEPYDAYSEQFQSIFHPSGSPRPQGGVDWTTAGTLALEHARILGLEALPRLVSGHRLPGFQSDPHPAVMEGKTAPVRQPQAEVLPVAVTVLGLGLAVAGFVALAVAGRRQSAIEVEAVRWGLLTTSALVLAAFVLNRNIFNSDNYRYLVLLLPAWAVGTGLVFDTLSRRGRGGRVAAWGLALGVAALLTLDVGQWYGRFGWVDRRGLPVERPWHDPAYDWLKAHPEIDGLFGSYWDVYRLSFLTGGRVKGVPYPIYPDRFPDWSSELPGHRPKVLLARPTGEGMYYRGLALRDGGRELHRAPRVWFVPWP